MSSQLRVRLLHNRRERTLDRIRTRLVARSQRYTHTDAINLARTKNRRNVRRKRMLLRDVVIL